MNRIRIAVSVDEGCDQPVGFTYDHAIVVETEAMPQDVGAAIAELVEEYMKRKGT